MADSDPIDGQADPAGSGDSEEVPVFDAVASARVWVTDLSALRGWLISQLDGHPDLAYIDDWKEPYTDEYGDDEVEGIEVITSQSGDSVTPLTTRAACWSLRSGSLYQACPESRPRKRTAKPPKSPSRRPSAASGNVCFVAGEGSIPR